MQKIIVIVGPTASGKSALGVYLAQKIDGEVISADSRQVYKGLNIGTGKIKHREMAGIPHHLLDVVSPQKQFTVDDFVKRARVACSYILKNKRVPIVVGGTGLYIDILLGRMGYGQVPPNPALRARLEKKSPGQLFSQLKKLDPTRAKTIEPHHKRRLIRAIEIARDKSRSKKNPEGVAFAHPVLWLGLNPQDLHKKISARLHARISAGMVAEARRLHKAGLSYKRMEELGLEYRSLARLLQDKLSKKEFSEQLEREIHRYAKRQIRWFKRNKDIHWVKNKTEALRLAKAFLSR